MLSIVRRDSGEGYQEFVICLAEESGKKIGVQSGDEFSPRGLLLNLNAEAGHVYEIHAVKFERVHQSATSFLGDIGLAAFGVAGRWSAWITDQQTGAVVAGKVPPRCQDLGAQDQMLCWSSEL